MTGRLVKESTRFWKPELDPAFGTGRYDHVNRWREEVRALNRLGIAMEIALQYLYFQRSDREALPITRLFRTVPRPITQRYRCCRKAAALERCQAPPR